MKKTIKEWLSELEEPYKSQAMANTNKEFLSFEEDSLTMALTGAFEWYSSPQKEDYWIRLNDKLKNENR
jgi:hypothetical protein